MKRTFGILAVTGTGMFSGALLAIGLILGSYWETLPHQQFTDVFNQNLGQIAVVLVIVGIPIFLGLGVSIWKNWNDSNDRKLWILSGVCIVALFALTAAWFLPTNDQFSNGSLSADQSASKLRTWLLLHNIRVVLAAVATIFGSFALSRQQS